MPPATEKANILINKGHNVINAVSYSSPVSSHKIDYHLKRALLSEFSEALINMKMSEKEAKIDARSCGASTSIWRIWKKLDADIVNIPEWAKEDNSNLIITLSFLGAWNEKNDEDKKIVEEMSGMEYQDFQNKISKFLRMDNPPLIKIDDIWLVSAPPTVFALIINHINKRHLEKIKIIVNKVFSEIDPTIEMPLNERYLTVSEDKNWKDFGRSSSEINTRSSVFRTYELYTQKIILHAGQSFKRWIDLLDVYPNVSVNHQKQMVTGLKSLPIKSLTYKEKYEIWKNLRILINKHKSFNNAAWAMKKEAIEELETVMNLYNPDCIVDQISWLFDSHYPDIPFSIYNHNENESELNKLRCNAINKLVAIGNNDLIFELINKVAYPYLIVSYLIEEARELNKIFDVFKCANEGSNNELQFARALSNELYERFKGDWFDILNKNYFSVTDVVEQKVNAIISFSDSLKTYEIVSSLGSEVEKKYWSMKFPILYSDDEKVIEYAINKLFSSGRYIDIICHMHEKIKIFGPQKVMQIIDYSLNELNDNKTDINISDYGYHIKILLRWLRKQNEVDKNKVAKREYAFLPFLTAYGYEEHLTLHELMASDSEFFVEILCDLFRASDEKDDDFKPSETQQQRAKFAWDLLRTWKIVPGVDEAGHINKNNLNKWVYNALKIAEQKKRLNHAYNYIGQVFYYAPVDPSDNIWPCNAIRELIEELENDDLERGIEIEQFNARGVVFKKMFEGGEQEKELARKWREWQKNIDIKWLRTKKILGRIADKWEQHAKREDIDAEKQKIKFG